jgi:hypothetical protein
MRWEQFFWVVYGVGSTLFVFFLFKLGNAVASNRQETVERESEQSQGSDPAGKNRVSEVIGLRPNHTNRTPVQRATRLGETDPAEAVASIEAARDFLLTTGGFQTDSGVPMQAEQGRRSS